VCVCVCIFVCESCSTLSVFVSLCSACVDVPRMCLGASLSLSLSLSIYIYIARRAGSLARRPSSLRARQGALRDLPAGIRGAHARGACRCGCCPRACAVARVRALFERRRHCPSLAAAFEQAPACWPIFDRSSRAGPCSAERRGPPHPGPRRLLLEPESWSSSDNPWRAFKGTKAGGPSPALRFPGRRGPDPCSRRPHLPFPAPLGAPATHQPEGRTPLF